MSELSSNDAWDTAAHWQLRLARGPLDAADEAALDRWLAADPRHRLALADAGAAWYGVAQAVPAAWESAPARARPSARAPWRAWLAGAAAAPLAVVLALAAPGWWTTLRADHATAPGATAVVALEDGSTLTLDGDSAVAVTFESGRRTIDVLRGAVHVAVEPDPARPFVVVAGGVSATAVGTAYAVDAADDAVVVAVDHGIVAVGADGDARHATLAAGQALRVDASGAARRVDAASAEHLAFLRGVIAFDATPLGEALARLDRQLPGRVVVLLDDAVLQRPVTAVFPLGDAAPALAALARSHDLDVRALPGFTIVRAR